MRDGNVIRLGLELEVTTSQEQDQDVSQRPRNPTRSPTRSCWCDSDGYGRQRSIPGLVRVGPMPGTGQPQCPQPEAACGCCPWDSDRLNLTCRTRQSSVAQTRTVTASFPSRSDGPFKAGWSQGHASGRLLPARRPSPGRATGLGCKVPAAATATGRVGTTTSCRRHDVGPLRGPRRAASAPVRGRPVPKHSARFKLKIAQPGSRPLGLGAPLFSSFHWHGPGRAATA